MAVSDDEAGGNSGGRNPGTEAPRLNNLVHTYAVTFIGHDSEARTHVNWFEAPGSYSKDVTYWNSMEQVRAVVDRSSHCKQYIKPEKNIAVPEDYKMRVLAHIAVFFVVLPLLPVAKTFPTNEKQRESFTGSEIAVKTVAKRSTECKNVYSNCACNYYKLKKHCDSPVYRVWMHENCAASCGVCVVAFDTQESTEKEDDTFAQDECLKLHNDIRRIHGAEDLTWCQKCAEFAQQVVTALRDANSPLQHSSPVYRRWLVDGKMVPHGENQMYNFPKVDCKTAVNSWYEEKPLYNQRHPLRDVETAGHFTQSALGLVSHITTKSLPPFSATSQGGA
ncbi:hypothetical protein Bbelb_100670 [Branchiostoma belcheri]|nr:hypothetical protein Bbelb_100670 [Branchiostoma belcheri]